MECFTKEIIGFFFISGKESEIIDVFQTQATKNGLLEIKFGHSEHLPNINVYCHYDILIMLPNLSTKISLLKARKMEGIKSF